MAPPLLRGRHLQLEPGRSLQHAIDFFYTSSTIQLIDILSYGYVVYAQISSSGYIRGTPRTPLS